MANLITGVIGITMLIIFMGFMLVWVEARARRRLPSSCSRSGPSLPCHFAAVRLEPPHRDHGALT